MTLARTIFLSACVALAGCAHNVSSDYANYLESNQGESRFPRTNVNARYYIAPQVREHSHQIRSAMAGAANTWNVRIGRMLADTLESTDYQAAFTSLTETNDADAAAGVVFKYQRANYVFTDTQAQIGLTIAVYRNGEKVFTEKYFRKGISQGGKMFWSGALGMANAVQQSTKSALDKILADSLAHFQVVMKNPVQAPQTALVTSASVGAATTAGDFQILQTGIAMDEVQEHAGWKAGTVWKGLKDGSPYQMTYVNVTGTSETIRDSDGCMWTRPDNFYAPSTEWTNCTSRDGKATVELKRPIFPFYVGKTWAFNVDAGRWRTSRECTVLDTARVRTVSGEHDTFKIVCKDKWNTRTRYYAPKLGAMVYYERHHRKRGQRTKYELIKIESATLSGAGSEQKQVSKASAGRKQDAAADAKTFAELVAALTILHEQGVLSDEEYMRKQREIINEHTRKTQTSLAGEDPLTKSGSGSPQDSSPSAATATALSVTSEKEISDSIPPIAVAVFPFARSGLVITNDADHLLPEFAHRYVSENRKLRLSESYFKQDGSKISGKSNYWSASNRPLDSQIYSDGAQLGVDVVLMYSYSGRYGSEDRFDVTVYLFDVKNRRTYQSNGNQDNYERVTESLFAEITATIVSSDLPSVATAGVTRESQATSLRVAILPFASAPAWFSSAEAELIEFSQDFVKDEKGLELAYSYYSSQIDSRVIKNPGAYWSGGYGAQRPIESSVYGIRNQLNVDVVLMYYHSPRTADPYASELYNAHVYVFDLKKMRLYHESGNERNYSGLTEQLFAQLIRARESSAGTNSPSRPTGATVVAAALATQATTTVPVSTPSESLPNTVMVPAPSQPQPQRLPAFEMRRQISGNTLSGTSERGSDFHVYHSPDGKMSGQARLAYYDVGTWEITDDGKYCRQWTNWREGARDCFEMFGGGEDRFRIRAINYHYDATFRIREGDPQDLKGRI